VRSCSVKAIAIKQGHAQLVDKKCVLCGKCITECPQQAKQVEDQTGTVLTALRSGRKVVISLAPSFIASFPDMTLEKLRSDLSAVGFWAIEETAVGAEIVASHYRQAVNNSNKTVISSCCPVIVSLIKKYYPTLVENLAPVLSPMLVHAKLLKHKHGNDCFVVFTGPCIAKIAEAKNNSPLIDAVLTFNQLNSLLAKLKPVNAAGEMAEQPDNSVTKPYKYARMFPIAGGILKATFPDADNNEELIAVDGLRQCILVFDSLAKGEIQPRFIEALSCIGGCVNGPESLNQPSLPARRGQVLSFSKRGSDGANSLPSLSFIHKHEPDPFIADMPSETTIREILKQTGKYSQQDEKNCGACGYNSCRDNAIAVYQGLTEIDTCVPYMRMKAESYANIIVDNSLSAIIVINEQLVIEDYNPAAERLFRAGMALAKGATLTEIMDCTDVIETLTTKQKAVSKLVEFPLLGLVLEKMIVPVPEHRLVFLIFTDITEQEYRRRKLERMKQETIDKATEIINKQMHVAQEIAGLLGETTAETKAALLELISLIQDKEAR